MKKAALITGALGGIGRAMCDEFATAGYRVIGTDRSVGALGFGRLIKADVRDLVTSSASRDTFLEQVLDGLQGASLSVLVNNAAIQILGGTEEVSLEDWRTTIDTNVLAPFVLGQMLLPYLSAAGGSIVNIASVHAVATKPRFVAYATSKAALVGLTKAMAVDLGPRLRINAILPAAVGTPMLIEGFSGAEDKLKQLGDAHPLGRIATGQEVARTAVFLASDAASFMSGTCLELDGGVMSRLHDPA